MEDDTSLELVQQPRSLATVGELANYFASQTLLEDYQHKRSPQTLRRQRADIALFAQFLAEAQYKANDLHNDLTSWAGITWGLVEGFNRWQLQEGYAIGSINVRLATIKVYCHLARKANALDATEYAMITAIKVINSQDGRNIDEKREQRGNSNNRYVTFAVALQSDRFLFVFGLLAIVTHL